MKADNKFTRDFLVHQNLHTTSLLCLMASFFPILHLMGWKLGIFFLRQILPGSTSMSIFTAIGLITGAMAIYVRRKFTHTNFVLVIFSFIIFATGLFSTEEQFKLTLLGCAVLIMGLPDGPLKYGQLISLIYGGASIIAIISFLFRANHFYAFPFDGNNSTLALTSAFSFFVLMLAYIFSTPEEGYSKIMVSTTYSGSIARKLFWTIIILPPVLGVITRIGVELGFYSNNIQSTIFIIVFIVLLLRIIWTVTQNSEKDEKEMIKTKEQLDELFKKTRESEMRIKEVLENVPDAVIKVNGQGNIIFANKKVIECFGYDKDEIINLPVEVLIPERYRQKHISLRDNFIKSPMPRQMGRGLELFGKRKNGTEFPVDVALNPQESTEGVVITATIKDVTLELKKESKNRYLLSVSKILSESLDFEEALMKSLQIIVPELADGCVVRMADEKEKFMPVTVVHRNKAMEDLLAHYVELTTELPSLQEHLRSLNMKKKAVSILPTTLSIEQIPLEKELQELAIRHGIHDYLILPLISRSNVVGSISFILNYPGRFYDNDDIVFLGSVAERVGMSLDNALLYNEALRATKSREEILAIVSHDLKNPTAAIKLRAQSILRLKETDPENLVKTSTSILRSVDQMIVLINNLLDFSKMESGNLRIKKKEENIIDILSSVLEMMKLIANEKNIQIETEFSPNFPPVRCEAGRIAQVLSNLLGNAVKFTDIGGLIKVKAIYTYDKCVISVSDTGYGIPSEDIPKIFEKFWQSEKTKKYGSGLGLSIAQGIVEAHGGKIWVESVEGVGSTFFFTLPLESVESSQHLQ